MVLQDELASSRTLAVTRGVASTILKIIAALNWHTGTSGRYIININSGDTQREGDKEQLCGGKLKRGVNW